MTTVQQQWAGLGHAVNPHGELALLAQTGSRAYGTDHADSDYDFKGVYVGRLRSVLSLAPPPKTIDLKDPNDVVIYELSHFCKLAASANPTVLEILWSEEHLAGTLGSLLRQNRKAFLSKRVVQTYGGYALAQQKKAEAGTGGSRGVEHYKREKFHKHTLRLLMAGAHALRTGEVLVKLDDVHILDLDSTRSPSDESASTCSRSSWTPSTRRPRRPICRTSRTSARSPSLTQPQ
jgi:predicted nucleotidyltransferase